MISYALVAFLFATSTSAAQYTGTDTQLQLSLGQLIDGFVDWVNSAIDSFRPLAEGPQQAQPVDTFVDWINFILDGPPSSSAPKSSSQAFPVT